MLSYDPDAKVQSGKQELWAVLGWVAHAWKQWFGTEMTITSLNDGTHDKGSLHYKGFAGDIRTREWYSRAGAAWPEIHDHTHEIREFARMIRRELGERGVVVWLHPDDDVANKKTPRFPHLHVGVVRPTDLVRPGSQ